MVSDLDRNTILSVHQRLLPALERALASGLSRDVEMTVDAVETLTIGKYLRSLGDICWNYCFKMGLREGGHLAFSLPLVVSLQNPAADGDMVRARVGEILAGPADGRWATDAEYRVIALLVKELAEEIESVWQIDAAQGLADIDLQTATAAIEQSHLDAPAVHVKMPITAAGFSDLAVHLCYRQATIEPLLSDLS